MFVLKKRIFCAVFFAFMFVFITGCGCNTLVPRTKSIVFDSCFTDDDTPYILRTEIDNDCNCSITVTEPEIIRGLKLCSDADGIRAEYKGLAYTYKDNSMTFSNCADLIIGAFKTAQGGTAKLSDGNYVLDGNFNGTDFKMYFSGTGLPIYMETNSIKIEFNNVTLI